MQNEKQHEQLVREAIRALKGIVTTQSAQISDLKTRIDDLEQAMGEHYEGHAPQYPPEEYDIAIVKPPHIIGTIHPPKGFGETPSRDYLEGQADMLETTGTHPPNCRCHWCEPPDHLERLGEWFR